MGELISLFFFYYEPKVSFQKPPQKERAHKREGSKRED
jgi:hypothetical protein